MIKKRLMLVLLVVLKVPPVHAEWVDVTGDLAQTDLRLVTVSSGGWYAATEKDVYRTADGGAKWKRTLGLRGSDKKIHFIYSDPTGVYVATTDGVKKTGDGKRWETFYTGSGGSKAVYAIAPAPEAGLLWLATDKGIVSVSPSGDAGRLGDFPDDAVRSIAVDSNDVYTAFAQTDKGIYRFKGGAWSLVHPFIRSENPATESLEQFDIEEAFVPAAQPPLLVQKTGVLAATPRGLSFSPNGEGWSALKGQTVPDRSVRYLAGSAAAFYVAAESGIYRWDEKAGLLRPASEGLASTDVRAIAYDAEGDFLLAATKKGVYRWTHPDLAYQPVTEIPQPAPQQAREFLSRFSTEPTIRQIQEAAVQYAEVHPNKIAEWRRAAARKAILPNVSLSGGIDTNENVDLDRGGTGDPDHFIIGPRERSFDWSVGLSWDLGDLIWNDDQTSIDTRSKLMAELRDDVLNEVTHLYYERRRLQAEMGMSAAKDLPVLVHKEIRMEELTAGIDALTGGYLSAHLPDRIVVQQGGKV